MVGANLEKVKLCEASLKDANLTNVVLRYADLRNVKDVNTATLTGADLRYTFVGLSTDFDEMDGIIFAEPNRDKPAENEDLIGNADLSINLDLSGIDSSDVDFSNVDLSGIKLDGAVFRDAKLGGVNWKEIDLKGVYLSKKRDLNSINTDGIPLTFLFNWDKVPGEDSEGLIEYLLQNFYFDWVKTDNIEQIDGGKSITISNGEHYLSLVHNDEKVNLIIGEYFFSWDNIPGNDNGRLIEFLNRHFTIEWVKTAEIKKIDDGRAINVCTGENSLSLNLNDEKTKVYLKIDDGRTCEFIAKTENSKLNIIYIDDKINYEFVAKMEDGKLNIYDFTEIVLKEGASLRKEKIGKKLELGEDIKSCVHIGIDLKDLNLSGVDLIEANLIVADMRNTNLTDAKLDRARMSGVRLNNANLYNASIKETNLTGASLSEADLRGADLRKAKLSGADFSKTNFGPTDMPEAKITNMREANLCGADLTNANLHRADLSCALLCGAKLDGTDLRDADLREADLSGASLNKADLRGAKLKGAILSGTQIKKWK